MHWCLVARMVYSFIKYDLTCEIAMYAADCSERREAVRLGPSLYT